MGFLAPWFLAGALALGVPVFLHLLRRHTTNPRPVSSLMFFEKRTQSSTRQRRLRFLLLLALRLAVLFFLVMAFANPFVNRRGKASAGDNLLLIVVDNSFSMREGTRLADAKREATSLLASRGGGSRAQVMTLGSQLTALTQPVQDPGVLRAAIAGIQPSDSRANFGELARGIRSLADSVHSPIEMHLFSDMQKSGMPASFSELSLPGNISLLLHPIVRDSVPNWTVESVNAPGQVWDPKKARVQAVIAGFHTPAATRSVTLVVNGKGVATQNANVPANGRVTVEFQTLDVPYGFSKCEVRIDSADTLPADDVTLFSVERADPEDVLFVHERGDTRSQVYFGAALVAAAESAFTVENVPADQMGNANLQKYAFVVLSDVTSVPSAFENDLLRYVQGGGSVLIAAGTSSSGHPHIPVFGGNISDTNDYSRGPERFTTVGDADPSHPSMQNIAKWSGVKFYYAEVVDPGDARVVARLTDGTPLLLDKKIGEGRVLLLASGLDNITNDFPLHPSFVPFIDQTARYLSGTERRSGSAVANSYLELRTAKEQAVSVEVIDPQGRRPLSIQEASSAQSFELTQAGFYELRLANGRRNVIGVNADRRESDLDVIPDETLALWKGNATPQTAASSPATASTTEEPVKPYGLWWYAMLVLLVAAIVESLFASGYLGTQREEP